MIEINLLPRKKKVINRFVQMLIIWSAVAVVFLTSLVGLFIYQTMTARRLVKDIAELDTQLSALQSTLDLMDKYEIQLEVLNKQMAIIDKLNRGRTHWARLLDDLADRVPTSMWLNTIAEKVDQNTGEERVVFTGLTYTNFAVADFMSSIEKSEFFERVDLVHATMGTLFGKKVVRFELYAVSKT